MLESYSYFAEWVIQTKAKLLLKQRWKLLEKKMVLGVYLAQQFGNVSHRGNSSVSSASTAS